MISVFPNSDPPHRHQEACLAVATGVIELFLRFRTLVTFPEMIVFATDSVFTKITPARLSYS